MTSILNVKTPVPVQNWTSSDGKVHDDFESARVHEVFLAVNPHLLNRDTRYQIVTELARLFDLLPRNPARCAPAGGPRCSVCGESQYETPHGLTCVNGHGGADSL